MFPENAARQVITSNNECNENLPEQKLAEEEDVHGRFHIDHGRQVDEEFQSVEKESRHDRQVDEEFQSAEKEGHQQHTHDGELEKAEEKEDAYLDKKDEHRENGAHS